MGASQCIAAEGTGTASAVATFPGAAPTAAENIAPAVSKHSLHTPQFSLGKEALHSRQRLRRISTRGSISALRTAPACERYRACGGARAYQCCRDSGLVPRQRLFMRKTLSLSLSLSRSLSLARSLARSLALLDSLRSRAPRGGRGPGRGRARPGPGGGGGGGGSASGPGREKNKYASSLCDSPCTYYLLTFSLSPAPGALTCKSVVLWTDLYLWLQLTGCADVSLTSPRSRTVRSKRPPTARQTRLFQWRRSTVGRTGVAPRPFARSTSDTYGEAESDTAGR